MLQNLPWPEVLLGIAAALAILVIYDVVLRLADSSPDLSV